MRNVNGHIQWAFKLISRKSFLRLMHQMKTFHLSGLNPLFSLCKICLPETLGEKMFEWKNEEPEVVEKGKMQ